MGLSAMEQLHQYQPTQTLVRRGIERGTGKDRGLRGTGGKGPERGTGKDRGLRETGGKGPERGTGKDRGLREGLVRTGD